MVGTHRERVGPAVAKAQKNKSPLAPPAASKHTTGARRKQHKPLSRALFLPCCCGSANRVDAILALEKNGKCIRDTVRHQEAVQRTQHAPYLGPPQTAITVCSIATFWQAECRGSLGQLLDKTAIDTTRVLFCKHQRSHTKKAATGRWKTYRTVQASH